jgi:MHS family proline/betaine transporter-like MFS transporter
MKKIVISGMLGNGLEWYDYALYGHMAFIISKLFFPGDDPTTQLLATFGVFAVGFVFRPLGAILFGYIGDRYGRRSSLTIAILMMAIPTGAIGLLPTYEHIGIWAPILLTIIRIFQGLSLGGEFAGSITYIVEHAPAHRKGVAGAASLVSLMMGFMLGSGVALACAGLMEQEFFETYGWRIPFLFGIGIGLVGFYIRHSCDESPEYQEAKDAGHISATPLREAVRQHPWQLLQGFTIYLTVTMPFYLLSIYLITFTKTELERSASEALFINFLAMGTMLVATLISAHISDRIGRARVMMPMAAALFAVIIPVFMLMGTKEFADILIAQVIFAALLGGYMGPVAALLVELFPTRVRYTGMALAYNLSAALFGGTAPMACVWLISATGSYLSIAVYMMACCILSFIALRYFKPVSSTVISRP